MATIHNQAGNTSLALSVLSDGLRYHPEAKNLWVSRSHILEDNNQFDEARAGFLKVMQMTEPEPGRPVGVGTSTFMRTVAAYQLTVLDLSTKNFVEAEHYARIAVSLNSKEINLHRALAWSLRGQGRVKEEC